MTNNEVLARFLIDLDLALPVDLTAQLMSEGFIINDLIRSIEEGDLDGKGDIHDTKGNCNVPLSCGTCEL